MEIQELMNELGKRLPNVSMVIELQKGDSFFIRWRIKFINGYTSVRVHENNVDVERVANSIIEQAQYHLKEIMTNNLQ